MRTTLFDPESMRRPDAPPGLFLDDEGRWFHDGDWVRHERLCALLNRSIARNAKGDLIVTTGRDVLPFIAERTPLIAMTISESAGRPVLVLSDLSQEPLDDVTIAATESGAIFAVVKDGQFWARCARPAVQWLTARLAEREDGTYQVDANPPVPVALFDLDKVDLAAIPPKALSRLF